MGEQPSTPPALPRRGMLGVVGAGFWLVLLWLPSLLLLLLPVQLASLGGPAAEEEEAVEGAGEREEQVDGGSQGSRTHASQVSSGSSPALALPCHAEEEVW